MTAYPINHSLTGQCRDCVWTASWQVCALYSIPDDVARLQNQICYSYVMQQTVNLKSKKLSVFTDCFIMTWRTIYYFFMHGVTFIQQSPFGLCEKWGDKFEDFFLRLTLMTPPGWYSSKWALLSSNIFLYFHISSDVTCSYFTLLIINNSHSPSERQNSFYLILMSPSWSTSTGE